jgi:hypothetical protein
MDGCRSLAVFTVAFVRICAASKTDTDSEADGESAVVGIIEAKKNPRLAGSCG